MQVSEILLIFVATKEIEVQFSNRQFMDEQVLVGNYAKYERFLTNIIGKESYTKLITAVGGAEKVMRASYALNQSSGLAFDGAMIFATINIAKMACQINAILPESKRVEDKAIYKVALLQHISKVVMYEPNPSDWERNNRGFIYRFTERGTTLKTGELSALFALNNGVQFTEEEFEAVRVNDKMKEEGKTGTVEKNALSMVIRQATEMLACIYKEDNNG